MLKPIAALLACSALLAGCGSDGEDILPSGQPLTEEQKAAIKTEDARVEAEEGQSVRFDQEAN